jgi:catechol 2,3-dioxygenase-like lactoylglutathione lyase family enzyme
MVTGAHALIFSQDADADRAFFRDVLKLTNVDVGDGWLIFGLPPSELAVHPSGENDLHQIYLMCDDIDSFVAEMDRHGIPCASIRDERWGLLTELTLPGGGRLGVYEARHPRPNPTAG